MNELELNPQRNLRVPTLQKIEPTKRAVANVKKLRTRL